MPEMIIFIGLQASGKTTFYRRFLALTHEHISKDRMRNVRRPGERQEALIHAALAGGKSVAIDNTNPSPEVRAPLIAAARQHGVKVIGIYFDADIRGCQARNAARMGKEKVDPAALFTTRKALRPPEYSEGFDEILTVRLKEDGDFELQPA